MNIGEMMKGRKLFRFLSYSSWKKFVHVFSYSARIKLDVRKLIV